MTSVHNRTHHQVTYAVLAVAVAAFAMLQSMVVPVLPTIQSELGTSQANVTWVLTAYLLSASIFTPIVGRLGDMYGKKRMLVIALAALATGSLLAALASALPVMIVARVVQGIAGGTLPLSFGIIRDEFPRAKVSGAIGLTAALLSVGSGFGIVLAGSIVDVLSYHWLFWIPLIITSLAGVAAWALIPESPIRTRGRINWLTAVLLSSWLVALLLAVSQSGSWGWGSTKVISLLVAATAVAGVWIIVEARSANPLIDMTMMRIRGVWAANLIALLMGFGIFASFGFIPQFLQSPTSSGYGFGATVTESGLMLLPNAVAMFAVGLFSSSLAARLGSKKLLVIGSLTAAASHFMMAFVHSSEMEIYLATGVSGIGFGLVFSAMANVVVASVTPQQTGVASGMNANIRTIGGSFGAACMASVVAIGASPTGLPVESGYTYGFAMLGGAAVLAAVAALFVPAVKGAADTGLIHAADAPHNELVVAPRGNSVD
ncbi:MFS transporter [Rhodococcus pyridinivorans]|uniref:MFS transporter n=1 Tax=Rhodococcus pyridinivorans TaxID=103816 RepID=UPI0039B66362